MVLLKSVSEERDTVQPTIVRLFDKDVMHLFLTQIKAASTAKVTSVASKEKVKQRPQASNTVELLRVASSALGISPHHTMQVVGSGYLL